MEKEKFDVIYEHLMEEYSILEEGLPFMLPLALMPLLPSISTLTKISLIILVAKQLSNAPKIGAELLKWLESPEVKKWLRDKGITFELKDVIAWAKNQGLNIDIAKLQSLLGDKQFYSKLLEKFLKMTGTAWETVKKVGMDIVNDPKNQKHTFGIDNLKALSKQKTPTEYRTPRLNLVGKIGSK